jgi:hypothetical protein
MRVAVRLAFEVNVFGIDGSYEASGRDPIGQPGGIGDNPPHGVAARVQCSGIVYLRHCPLGGIRKAVLHGWIVLRSVFPRAPLALLPGRDYSNEMFSQVEGTGEHRTRPPSRASRGTVAPVRNGQRRSTKHDPNGGHAVGRQRDIGDRPSDSSGRLSMATSRLEGCFS